VQNLEIATAVLVKLISSTIYDTCRWIAKIIKRKLPKEGTKEYEKTAVKIVNAHIKGELGTALIKAFQEYLKTGKPSVFDYLRKEKRERISLVVEVSRPITEYVEIYLNKKPDYVLSLIKEVSTEEMKYITLAFHRLVYLINAIHNAPEIDLYISVPSTTAFLMGQIVGLSHYKITIYQFSKGKYHKIPQIKREELKIY